ncbi:MAG: hypothetical protein H8E03_01260 [Pelagibacteraceae bacterium]|nr:hypothetical protein [Pelagibacteraceae bacterium]
MWQKLIFLILFWSSVSAQSIFYSYIDPCEQTVVRSNYIINSEQQGFQVTYYNRTKFFTLEEALQVNEFGKTAIEVWAQSVYSDFEDLFPCAVKVAEEILSSVIAENVSEQFSKDDGGGEDISTTPQQVNYAIRSTPGPDNWITSFNSVYTATSFDGSKRHDGNFNFTNDFRKGSVTYGQGINFKAKKQNVVVNGSALTYKTFEGWDWLVSSSYAKSLQKKNMEAFVFTGTYGRVSGNNFGNITMVYGQRFPLDLGQIKFTFSNYMAYTLVRYYGGNNTGDRYLLLRSPIIFFPTLGMDWKLGQAFTFNLGVSMGYNTVVNDYGERSTSFSLLFGTYF